MKMRKGRKENTLTVSSIEALVVRHKVYRMYDGNNLHLEVQPCGTKRWRFVYRYQHKRVSITFGNYPEVSIEQARKFAQEARQCQDAYKQPLKVKKLFADKEEILNHQIQRNIATCNRHKDALVTRFIGFVDKWVKMLRHDTEIIAALEARVAKYKQNETS
jgi:hypothetical protein